MDELETLNLLKEANARLAETVSELTRVNIDLSSSTVSKLLKEENIKLTEAIAAVNKLNLLLVSQNCKLIQRNLALNDLPCPIGWQAKQEKYRNELWLQRQLIDRMAEDLKLQGKRIPIL
jgi:hypothetical protein